MVNIARIWSTYIGLNNIYKLLFSDGGISIEEVHKYIHIVDRTDNYAYLP